MDKIDTTTAEINSRDSVAVPHTELKLLKSAVGRWLCIILAWLCIVIAIFGIFIPGLPTVDFLILAVFFAARGSARLHYLLMSNKYIGPLILEWQRHRRIPQKVKYLSTLSMSLAAGIMIWSIPHPWFVYPIVGCMAMVNIWMWLKT